VLILETHGLLGSRLIGVNIGNPWITWFKAASVPALLGLLVTPYLIYKVFPPDDRINMTG